jgi:hypothetical protein
VLRYIADLSEADVASLLGCSAGTVKSHLNRGTTLASDLERFSWRTVMFEQLDDPDRFDVDEQFFTGTSRRFAKRHRNRAAARVAGGAACLLPLPLPPSWAPTSRIATTTFPPTNLCGRG